MRGFEGWGLWLTLLFCFFAVLTGTSWMCDCVRVRVVCVCAFPTSHVCPCIDRSSFACFPATFDAVKRVDVLVCCSSRAGAVLQKTRDAVYILALSVDALTVVLFWLGTRL